MSNVKRLKPCPYCGKTHYVYGFSMISFFGETLTAIPTSLNLLVARIITSGGHGMGIFSLPKSFYQGFFLDLDGDPLLRCTHCNSLVIACHKCDEFMLLERQPKTAELVECISCKARFQPTESDVIYDKLIKNTNC